MPLFPFESVRKLEAHSKHMGTSGSELLATTCVRTRQLMYKYMEPQDRSRNNCY